MKLAIPSCWTDLRICAGVGWSTGGAASAGGFPPRLVSAAWTPAMSSGSAAGGTELFAT